MTIIKAKQLVVLDTETTGLDDKAEILELAIVDSNGTPLINQRLRLSDDSKFSEEAYTVHGITLSDLKDCEQYPSIEAKLKEILIGKQVLIFNASYDIRLLKQTAAAYGCDTTWFDTLDTRCVMYQAANVYGSTNKYGTISLSNAVARAGIEWEGEAHSALGDTLTTLALYKKMARKAAEEVFFICN